jgi:hypothetical protein
MSVKPLVSARFSLGFVELLFGALLGPLLIYVICMSQ